MNETREALRTHIRWMIRRDLPEILEAEATLTEPWNDQTYLDILRNRNVIGMVAEVGEKVVGSMVYELFKDRLHVLRFLVTPGWERRRVGTQLINKLKSKLSSQRRTQITADVPEDALGLQLFLRAQSFLATSCDRGEETYRFTYKMSEF